MIKNKEGERAMVGAIIFIAFFVGYAIYDSRYFRSERFIELKHRMSERVQDCIELNQYIEELRRTYINLNTLEREYSIYTDRSQARERKNEIEIQENQTYVYHCSRTVYNNAEQQPFKYICKYFDIKENEENLQRFEYVLNNFISAEEGKILLQKEQEDILESVKRELPEMIRFMNTNTGKIEKEIGLQKVDLDSPYFPKYVFKYVSPNGKTSLQNEIVMDIENLNKFVQYLYEKVKFKKSVARYRVPMTREVRYEIIKRDEHICQYCGNHICAEPNLLLEVEHYEPVSKGGETTKDNLHTICWRCKR